MIAPWYKQKFHKLFRKGSRKGHGIHSPFMFNLITNEVENPFQFSAFNLLKDNLESLYRSKEAIHIEAWGKYFGLPQGIYTKGKIAQRTELNQNSGELIFRIINRFKCRNIIHYGPTLGSNLLYLTLADSRIQLNIIGQASECVTSVDELLCKSSPSSPINADKFAFSDNYLTDLVLINFPESVDKTQEALETVRPHLKEGAIVVIRGINANTEIASWWKTLKKQQTTGVTLDLNIIGLLFLRSDLQNQHFIY